MKEGAAGSLLFVTDPAEINPPATAHHHGTGWAFRRSSGFDVIHGSARSSRCRSRWPPPGSRTIERGQAVAARESRAVGIHWTFAPMVDIPATHLGSDHRGAGEDPYLGAAVAVAQVRGFQGGELVHRTTSSPAQALAGLVPRSWPRLRRGQPVRLRLWNVYFPPFRAQSRPVRATS